MNSIPEWLKIEIVRTLHEGVSEEGIKAIVDVLDGTPGITDNFWNEALHYATCVVEYGRREESNVVKGTVVYPVTDETRLLPEMKP